MSSHRITSRRAAARINATLAAIALALAGPAAVTAAPQAHADPLTRAPASTPAQAQAQALRQEQAQVRTRKRAQPKPVEDCVVQDNRLTELSGLAADGEFRYAVGDGGRRLQVIVLRRDCTVHRVIAAAVDPFDIEDLALGPDGRLWLADIGDNDRRRTTVALHVLAQNGAPELYRLTYPDGPHDAEALLLDRDGQPYIITKESFGASGVYRPAGPLVAPGPTPLELVTSVRFSRTETPGGPVGSMGSMLITGGASSADGSVVALRTYTDVYLYSVPDGDLITALGTEPIRVPLPDEPQGEAIAFEPDGTLLSGSERADSGPQPLRALRDAAALVTSTQPSPVEPSAQPSAPPPAAPAEPDRGGLADWQAVLIAILGAAAVIVVVGRLVRRT